MFQSVYRVLLVCSVTAVVLAILMANVTKATIAHQARQSRNQTYILALLDTSVRRNHPYQNAVQMAHTKITSIHLNARNVWLGTTVTTQQWLWAIWLDMNVLRDIFAPQGPHLQHNTSAPLEHGATRLSLNELTSAQSALPGKDNMYVTL